MKLRKDSKTLRWFQIITIMIVVMISIFDKFPRLVIVIVWLSLWIFVLHLMALWFVNGQWTYFPSSGGRSVGRTTTNRSTTYYYSTNFCGTSLATITINTKSLSAEEIKSQPRDSILWIHTQLGQAWLVRHDFILWQSYKRQTDERTNEQPFLFIIINFIFRVFAFLVIALKDGRTNNEVVVVIVIVVFYFLYGLSK